jgi:hypothetical protein
MMMVPDEGTFAVRAEPAAVETTAATGPPREGTRWLTVWFRSARDLGTWQV